MNNTISSAGIGRPWIVGLVVFGGGLLLTSPNIAWYWLPLALLIVGGLSWALISHELESRTGSYKLRPDTTVDREAALDTLKQQYAVGEIDDTEFERRLETLLENESIADVETRLDLDSEATNETQRVEQGTSKQIPHHGQKCHRRGKHQHGRH
ncbi:SHOCT domain-containing protein [Haladaptatus sp. NG-SE-30]